MPTLTLETTLMPMLKLDHFDRALFGVASVWQKSEGGGANRVDTLIYDGNVLVEILMEEGLTDEEALEYIDFNIVGAYVGESTPIIAWPCDMDKVNELVEQSGE